MITIDNIRLGHATNSSSSHSIIILPKGHELPSSEYPHDDFTFGWEHFVLTEKNEKTRYLIAAIYANLVDELGEEIAHMVVKELFDFDLPVYDSLDIYIDHNSDFNLMPFDASTKKVSLDFIRDLGDFFAKENVVVFGGNDNDDDPGSWGKYKNAGERLSIYYSVTASPFLCKKTGDWWTLFNSNTGARLRFSFLDTPAPYTRSSTPDLVDIKITDYCTYGCPYCYQDSTKEGKHADTKDVKDYLTELGNCGVFEVAIGGGEPTAHPDFIEILSHARECGIVPNFTTRKKPSSWNSDLIEATKKYCGGVAISGREHIAEIYALKKLHNINASLQIVNCIYSAAEYREIFEVCRDKFIDIVLLGYKNVGRGTSYKYKNAGITAETLLSARRLSVDTAFIEQNKDLLNIAEISSKLHVDGEGANSMYIDAVTKFASKSSYQTNQNVTYDPYPWRANLPDVWEQLES